MIFTVIINYHRRIQYSIRCIYQIVLDVLEKTSLVFLSLCVAFVCFVPVSKLYHTDPSKYRLITFISFMCGSGYAEDNKCGQYMVYPSSQTGSYGFVLFTSQYSY